MTQMKKLVIFGKHGHAEVVGLQGQTNNDALVFLEYRRIGTT